MVTLTGIAVKAPLAKVPENWMKFAVGVMLTSFGTFWGAEGAGVPGPAATPPCSSSSPWSPSSSAACVFWLRAP